ncbi:cellular communication network factor 1, like 1 [Conger conger]|uniref:cellular communication network factor 1, like 1 n=1 Tax=Conger conger TaxID=82655 RepID=UPI002A5A876B|nr:cellular communication network factor 1, like 1 [Conger conger]
MFSTCFLVALSCAALTVEAGCPLACSCPAIPPSCPLGVSTVTDGCGCCKVCASQFNQDCSLTQPCDHIKGLRCHLGAGGDPARGLCRAEEQGRPCELNGRVYQHGEDFQPGCQHQCSCMDGVVGCMPLCPHQVPLPNWRCASPRLARPPGGCCEQWYCDDPNHISEDSPPPRPNRHPDPAGNELLLALSPRRTSTAIPQDWMSLSESHGLITSKCFPQTTDWSPCSATCGMGVSSRVTNSNADCRLVRETRLCQIRQCDLALAPPLRKGKRCQRTVRPERPVRVHFAGCSTARRYRPRSCGSCSDGRCCSPSATRTVRLRFHCPAGDSFARSVMWIQRCSCRRRHADRCHDDGPQPPSASPHSDIHTFQH